jgi:hypothetical protein
MFFNVDTFFLLPPLWHAGLLVLAILVLECFMRRHEYWALPALAVYGTTWLWYFPDMNVRWHAYQQAFDGWEIDFALAQVIAYLLAFRFLLPPLTRKFIGDEEFSSKVPSLTQADSLFLVVFFCWLAILVFGILTHGKGIIESLFPMGGRRTWSFMFGRSAVGGSFDWLISIAGNTYTILVIFLGLFIFLPKSSNLQYVNVGAYLISLPFFIMTGTRTSFMQVFLPVFLGYFLLSNQPLKRKIVAGLAFFLLANSILITMILYRNSGFENVFSSSDSTGATTGQEAFHDGANMLEELLYINSFQRSGVYPIQLGGNYFAELCQFIPRAYWPGKPLIGVELSILRGFTDGSGRQTGTVAMGKVGQGVVNVGPYLGPIITALLVAAYCAWLGRLWVQGQSYMRTCLYIGGLCFVFNLGRNVGILNLWPMVFGYCMVAFLEKSLSNKTGSDLADTPRNDGGIVSAGIVPHA